MPDLTTLAAASLAIFAAAFVQGVTGFGHALLAIGFLSLLYGSSDAVLILSLLAPVIAVAIFVRVRKEVNWREALAIALPLCLLGMPLGIFAFSVLREYESALTITVGALLVVFAGYFLTPWAPRPRDLPLPVTATAGFLGGFLGGLASTGGPPVVLYLYAREMPKVQRMAVLQAVFVIGSLVKVAMLIPTGMVTERVTVTSLLLVAPMLGGVLLGQKVFDRIPAEPLRKASLALLVVLGIVLLASCSSTRKAEPLHFRLEVGPAPVKVITGTLLSEGADGKHHAAIVDLDGDGVAETRRSGIQVILLAEGVEVEERIPEVRFRHAGLDWYVTVETWKLDDGETTTDLTWVAEAGDSGVLFIGGDLRLSPTPESVQPTRIGPPFHWMLSSGTETMNVTLLDPARCRIRAAFTGERDILPKLSVDGDTFVVEYG